MMSLAMRPHTVKADDAPLTRRTTWIGQRMSGRASVSNRLAGHGAPTRGRRCVRVRAAAEQREHDRSWKPSVSSSPPSPPSRRPRSWCVPSRPIARVVKRKSVPPPSVSRGPTVARAHPPPCSPPSPTRPPRVSSRNRMNSDANIADPFPVPVPPPPPVRVPRRRPRSPAITTWRRPPRFPAATCSSAARSP